jgi:hypothetical protein
MPKFATTASGAAVSALATGIAFASFFTSAAPQAKEGPGIISAVHQPLAKADRLPVRPTGAACSSRSWPYYDQDCRFDLRGPATEARTVRVIALR